MLTLRSVKKNDSTRTSTSTSTPTQAGPVIEEHVLPGNCGKSPVENQTGQVKKLYVQLYYFNLLFARYHSVSSKMYHTPPF